MYSFFICVYTYNFLLKIFEPGMLSLTPFFVFLLFCVFCLFTISSQPFETDSASSDQPSSAQDGEPVVTTPISTTTKRIKVIPESWVPLDFEPFIKFVPRP